MTSFRAAFKLIRFLLATWFYHSVILLGNLIAKFGMNSKSLISTIRMKWARSAIKILNMKLTVQGNAPEPPFFLVANHLSYIDVWVLFATAKGTFITKSDVQDWPLVGFVLSTSGMIFVNRDRKADVTRVNAEISKNITKDQGVFLFPESTTSNGEGILPFKSSLFQFPATEGIEVTSAAISYSSEDPNVEVSSEICWWEDVSFPAHFWNVLKLKEFKATITYSDQKLVHSNRKNLACTTFDIIQDLFEPVKQPKTNAESTSSVTV
jgi:1-acyl-sn-glycerol-3-phosphate acyltransferase